jgi:hypothetical protein
LSGTATVQTATAQTFPAIVAASTTPTTPTAHGGKVILSIFVSMLCALALFL